MMGATHLIHGVAASTAYRDPEQLDHAIGQLLCRFLGTRSIALYHLFREEEGSRTAVRIELSNQGVRTDTLCLTEPLTPALSDEIAACRASVASKQFAERPSVGGEILTAFPVHASHDVVRVCVVPSSESLSVAQIDMVFGVLRIIENHLALVDYGERDTLTGLLNRKTFESHFEKMRRRNGPVDSGRALEPSWLAMADVDMFKSINDSHGHLFGDEVLLMVSQILKRSFRGADQLFRFGGEEFVIVLDHATEAGAQVALERFRTAVETHTFPQIPRVTISLGYTRILPHDVPTLCAERADDALYYAKRNGRNRVCHYEALVTAGDLKPKTNVTDVELF